MARCFDCLEPFAPTEPRFAVLKCMHSPPVEGLPDPYDAPLFVYTQEFVCSGCAGWYGDHAIALSAEEASL